MSGTPDPKVEGVSVDWFRHFLYKDRHLLHLHTHIEIYLPEHRHARAHIHPHTYTQVVVDIDIGTPAHMLEHTRSLSHTKTHTHYPQGTGGIDHTWAMQ